MSVHLDPVVTIEPLAVKRSTACKLLDCGPTKIWQLQKSGELETIKVGADDRILVDSIRLWIEKQRAKA